MKTIGELIDAGVISRETKVVGELPMTADACIAGAGSELWGDFNKPGTNAPCQCTGPAMPCVPMSRLYGNREAAQAALAAKEATDAE